jgi:hypothetical protein
VNARTIVVRAVVLAAVGLVLGAGPAAADAAKPGKWSSEVTSVDPDPGWLSVETAGGDAFLSVEVDEGHELIVLGYEGEPYLRFNPDGTVEENQSSPATYINTDRYGTNELAPDELQGADVAALDPEWQQVATGGSYAWHDHRTHFMGGDVPAEGRIDWTVPMVADGEDVTVTGVMTYEGSSSPVLWYAIAVVVLIGLAVLGPKLPDRAAPALVALVAALATWVAYAGYASQPSGTGASIVPTVVGAIALVLALLALAVDRLRAVGLLAAGVFLATWGVFRLSVLSNPVLPTDVPFALERLTTALALGVGVGAVVLAFRSGALTLALMPLDEDEPDPA